MVQMRIGDKVVEVSEFKMIDGKMVPVIKVETQEIKREDGSQDVIVSVPCMQVSSKTNN